MSTQAEIDLEARIGDLERQLAELSAKVNPLYSGGMDRYIHSGYLQFDGIPMRWDNTGRQIVVGGSTSDRYFYEFLVSQLTTNPGSKFPLLASGGYVSATELQQDVSAYLTSGNYGRVFVFADNTPSQRGGAEAARGATVAQVFANIGETDDGHVKVKPAILFERVASRPTGLAEGGLWAGTDDKLYFYDGAADIDLTGGGGMPMPPVVGTMSWHCIGAQLAANATPAAGSFAWHAANGAVYIPLLVTEDITVKKLWWLNGNTVSGNVNMALYTAAFAQVSGTETGSTAQAGTTEVQEVDIADTALSAGLYYVAITLDNTTGTLLQYNIASGLARMWGLAEQASVFDLPATATLGDAAGRAPVCGIATRTQVA